MIFLFTDDLFYLLLLSLMISFIIIVLL